MDAIARPVEASLVELIHAPDLDAVHDHVAAQITNGVPGHAQTRREFGRISWIAMTQQHARVAAPPTRGVDRDGLADILLIDLAHGRAAATPDVFARGRLDTLIGNLNPMLAPDVRARNRRIVSALKGLRRNRPELFFR